MHHSHTRLRAFVVALVGAFVIAAGWWPQRVLATGGHGDHGAHKPQTPAPAPAAEMTDGEVRKIDKDAAKLTLKHAEIKSLDMPGMTMVFLVKDKAMLEKLQVGDKVKFRAVNDAGKLAVTEIQVVR